MTKRKRLLIEALIIMLAIVVIIFGGVYTFRVVKLAGKMKHFSAAPPSKASVSARPAEALTWHPKISAVANLKAVHGVEVTPGLGGLIGKITFASGDPVAEGDLLVQLDTEQDKAQLQGLKAQAQLSRINLKRQTTLYKQNVSSKSRLDKAQAEYDKARAAVVGQKAVIGKKTVRAPFDGVIGIRQVDLGQYIQPGTPIATLQALQPLYVDFALPQNFLPRIHTGQKVEVSVEGYPDKTFEASVAAIAPKVSGSTRTFRVRATLGNEDELLRPGMFGQVKVVLPARQHVVTLPQAAISHRAYGDLVFLVTRGGEPVTGSAQKAKASEGDNDKPLKVDAVFVTVGDRRGNQVEIVKGIKAGQLVVTSGQLKLKNGARIKINNKLEPPDNANPGPSDITTGSGL